MNKALYTVFALAFAIDIACGILAGGWADAIGYSIPYSTPHPHTTRTPPLTTQQVFGAASDTIQCSGYRDISICKLADPLERHHPSVSLCLLGTRKSCHGVLVCIFLTSNHKSLNFSPPPPPSFSFPNIGSITMFLCTTRNRIPKRKPTHPILLKI